MEWVSGHHIVEGTDANMILSVEYLGEKHQVAEQWLADAKAYLASVEESMNNCNLISSWQQELEKWEVDVLDVRNHATMGNPFEISDDAGVLLSLLCMTIADIH